jgi:DNA-directed RNA polymerase subunit RPC12/RpoP
MLKRLRTRFAILACSIITTSGLATGVIASCDGNYCSVNTGGCTPLNQSFQDSCCLPATGGYKCFTCWRQYYWCFNTMYAGSAYNCSNAGAWCS